MELHKRLINGNNTGSEGVIKTKQVPLSGSGLNLIIEACFLVLFTGLWTACTFFSPCTNQVTRQTTFCGTTANRSSASLVSSCPESLNIDRRLASSCCPGFLLRTSGNLFRVDRPRWRRTSYLRTSELPCRTICSGMICQLSMNRVFMSLTTIKSIFATQVLYALAIGFVKISITIMLMRLFIHRKVQIAGIVVIIISSLWMIMTWLVALLLCRPIKKNWEPAIPGTCGNSYVAFGVVAAVDIFNGLCLIILPMPSLWRLHLHQRYKLALAGVFGTGFMYVILTSVLVSLYPTGTDTSDSNSTMVIAALRIPLLLNTDFTDLTFDTRSQQIALAEPAVAIMVSCCPLLKPVLDKALLPFLGQGKTLVSRTTPASKAATDARPLYGNTAFRTYTRFDESYDEFRLENPVAPANQHIQVSAARPHLSDEYESMELGELCDQSKIMITREMIVTNYPLQQV